MLGNKRPREDNAVRLSVSRQGLGDVKLGNLWRWELREIPQKETVNGGLRWGEENKQVEATILRRGFMKKGNVDRKEWIPQPAPVSDKGVSPVSDKGERDHLLAFLSVIKQRLDLTLEVDNAEHMLSDEAEKQLAEMADNHETCSLRSAQLSDVLQEFKNLEFLVVVERQHDADREDAVAGAVVSQGAQSRCGYTLHCYVCRLGFEALRCGNLPVCLDMDKTMLLCEFLGDKYPPRKWSIDYDSSGTWDQTSLNASLRQCNALREKANKQLENVEAQRGSDSAIRDKKKAIAWVDDQELLLHFARACKEGEEELTIGIGPARVSKKIHYNSGDPVVAFKRHSCRAVISSYNKRPYILYLRPKIADLLLDARFEFFFATQATACVAMSYLKHIYFWYREVFDKKAPGWLGAAISRTTSFRKTDVEGHFDGFIDKSFEIALRISELSKELCAEHETQRSEVIRLNRELYVEHKTGKLRCHGEFAVGVDDLAGHRDSSGAAKKDPWREDEQDRVIAIQPFHPVDCIEDTASENKLANNVMPLLRGIQHDFFEQLKPDRVCRKKDCCCLKIHSVRSLSVIKKHLNDVITSKSTDLDNPWLHAIGSPSHSPTTSPRHV